MLFRQAYSVSVWLLSWLYFIHLTAVFVLFLLYATVFFYNFLHIYLQLRFIICILYNKWMNAMLQWHTWPDIPLYLFHFTWTWKSHPGSFNRYVNKPNQFNHVVQCLQLLTGKPFSWLKYLWASLVVGRITEPAVAQSLHFFFKSFVLHRSKIT